MLSELSTIDKVDILTYAQPTFLKLKSIFNTRKDKKLFWLIKDGKYYDAVKLCDYLAYEYPEKREHIKELVKQRDIYILSPKIDIEMSGIEHTIRYRANYLEEQGYNVIIINLDTIKNYPYILNYYYENNGLSQNIKFYNIYEYYSKKNTYGKTVKVLDETILNTKDNLIRFKNNYVKKNSQ